MKRLLARYVFLFLTLLPSSALFAVDPPHQKIVIMWGDYGNGHKSAAKSIEGQVKAQNPSVDIAMKSINDFLTPFEDKTSKWVFENSVHYTPWLYDWGFNRYVWFGARISSVGDMPHINRRTALKIAAYLNEQKPDVIVTTFPNLVEYLVYMRKEGLISKEIPIHWQHTDYVPDQYFANLARDLDQPNDRVFVPHEGIRQEWIDKYKLPGERLQAIGIPVDSRWDQPMEDAQRTSFLTAEGLEPARKTITIMSGGNGVGDYSLMVRKIAESMKGSDHSIQIAAICGKNEVCKQKMEALRAELDANFQENLRKTLIEIERELQLPMGSKLKARFYALKQSYSKERLDSLLAELEKFIPAQQQNRYDGIKFRINQALSRRVILKVNGFVKNAMEWVKASDVFIGKAGGISSTELSHISGRRRPSIILLDINGGQEKSNIRLFDAKELAWWTGDQAEVGKISREILDHPDEAARRAGNMDEFRKGFGIERAGQAETRHGKTVVDTLAKLAALSKEEKSVGSEASLEKLALRYRSCLKIISEANLGR